MTLFRYPGGKSRGPLHHRILELVKSRYGGGTFVEPFFGGGAITIALLKEKSLDRVSIAEKDSALLTFWQQVRERPGLLQNQVLDFVPSVGAFLEAKERVLSGKGKGFDALVVNRLSHSGRGVMSAPQGGLNQTGKYKIDCRWSPEKLAENIGIVHELFCSVDMSFYDDYQKCRGKFFYVDPPYWKAGSQLYKHGFDITEHARLRAWLGDLESDWLLSYDNHPAIKYLYGDYTHEVASTSGNGGEKPDSEILIWNW